VTQCPKIIVGLMANFGKVFYQTFTNVFFNFFSTFLRFLTFFYFYLNVYYICSLSRLIFRVVFFLIVRCFQS